MAGCFPDKTGYAVGSVEGRCSIAYIEDTSKNFAFKWHGKAAKRLWEDVAGVAKTNWHLVA